MNEDINKPTLSKPSVQGKNFEKNFKYNMNKYNVHLNEIDSLLSETEFSLKRKIFDLSKMEALIFSDPKLTAVYDEMSKEGKDKYGYHYNETIVNQIFNDYVLNSPKYLQKYKMAVPKKKKRRDKSGIDQLRKSSEKSGTHIKEPKIPSPSETTGAASSGAFAPALGFKQEKSVSETTTSASSGAYAGPAAWSTKGDLSGDLKKSGKGSGRANPLRKPIYHGGSIIAESNYLLESNGFEEFFNMLNESDLSNPNVYIDDRDKVDNFIIDKTNAFTSDGIKKWNDLDSKIELNTIETGKMDEPNLSTMEENKYIQEKAVSKKQQKFMGMVHAIQKGELSPKEVGGSVAKAAKSMNASDVEDFASTKHKGLPEKKKEKKKVNENMNNIINENRINEFIEIGQNAMGLKSHPIVDDFLKIHPEYNNNPNWKGISEMLGSLDDEGGDYNDINFHRAIEYILGSEIAPEFIEYMSQAPATVAEDTQSMINNNPMTMANKMQPGGEQSSNVTMGMTSTSGGGMSENEKLFEELNEELETYSKLHNKLKIMSEDKKPSSLVMKDRLGAENVKNFKQDLGQSGTKEIIDIQKELQYKDQQTEVGDDPQKLGLDIEKKALSVTKGNALENVGDSDNDKGNEIPKRNMTTDEQNAVDMMRNGQHSLVYDNKPSQRFEDRMKADMGDKIYDMRQKQMDFKSKAPLYNKDSQPTEKGDINTQYDKEKSKWNDENGLNESMITGRYEDLLGKKHIIDFQLNEAKIVTDEKAVEKLFELDFTGFGNKYISKTQNYKVSVNESVDNFISTNKFYTNGIEVFAIKNKSQVLNENVNPEIKPMVNEQVNKMKHLLGYKPSNYVDTSVIKKDRGF